MKFSYPDINTFFDICDDRVHSLVIENKTLFCELVQDIYDQIAGYTGKAVLAEDNQLLHFSQYIDLTTSFIPFEINRKPLINKIFSSLEQVSKTAEYYDATMHFLADTEKYLDELSYAFPCDFRYEKLGISAIIRAVGLEVQDNSRSIADRFLNYIELVREFDRDKLFIVVNMRNYIENATMEEFLATVLTHKYNLLMLESTSHPLLINESRYTVDEDLCEF